MPYDQAVVNFAVAEGFRIAQSDQTPEETVEAVARRNGISKTAALELVKAGIMEEVEAFFVSKLGARK